MDHYTELILGCFTLNIALQLTLFAIKQVQMSRHTRILKSMQEDRDFQRRRKRQALLLLKQRRKAS